MPTTCRAQRLCQHSAICSRLSDCFAALCCCFVRRGRLVSSKRPTFIPGPAVCEICAGSRPPWAVPLVNHPQSFRLPSHDEASPCHAFPDHSRFPGASIDGPGPSTGLIVRQEPRYLAHPPPPPKFTQRPSRSEECSPFYDETRLALSSDPTVPHHSTDPEGSRLHHCQ